MDFMNMIKNELNTSTTENGAIGYKSTGNELVDLNFAVSSMRGWTEDQIINAFGQAYAKYGILAIKWLFYLRDARQGLGERRTFRIILKWLAKTYPYDIRGLVGTHSTFTMKNGPIIPFYGRWDDLFVFENTYLWNDTLNTIYGTFLDDIDKLQKIGINTKFKDTFHGEDDDIAMHYKETVKNHPELRISYLAKWLPSINATNSDSRRIARKLVKAFGISNKYYRRALAVMRRCLSVTERLMSDNEWDQINYEAVPSNANLKYSKAFIKHDPERRNTYIQALAEGKAKINSSTLFPHEIVHKYGNFPDHFIVDLEAMWKSLPNTVTDPNQSVICVYDGSGSMLSNIPGSRVKALTVAQALTIYFSERLNGAFKNKAIRFSDKPKVIDLSSFATLYEKIHYLASIQECFGTNIESVFDTILNTAIYNNVSPEDLPKNVLIISDMEFNEGVYSAEKINSLSDRERGWRFGSDKFKIPLMEEIKQRYIDAGYQLPKVTFWNVNSRTNTIPMTENENGVGLVSGFSVNVVKSVMNLTKDPWDVLKEILNSDRYYILEHVVRPGNPMNFRNMTADTDPTDAEKLKKRGSRNKAIAYWEHANVVNRPNSPWAADTYNNFMSHVCDNCRNRRRK